MSASQEWFGMLFAWVVRAGWQASVIVVLVLLMQFLLRRVLSAQWRCSLWFLVLIRLALPFSCESSISIFNAAPQPPAVGPIQTRQQVSQHFLFPTSPIRSPVATAAATHEPASAGAAKGQPSRLVSAEPYYPNWKSPVDLRSLVRRLPYFWLLGVILLVARVVWANARLASRVRRRQPLTDLRVLQLAAECRNTIGLRQIPWIVETSDVGGPALFGFTVPRLLLPIGLFDVFALHELRHVFLHEFCHMRRRDIAFNWLTVLFQVLHWFNPFVWYAANRMRSDRELACDALVLSKLPPGDAKDYGNTIIRLLENFAQPAPAPGLVGILEDRSQMKRRVRMISRFKRNRSPWRWAARGCLLLLAVAALTDARTHNGQISGGGPSQERRVTIRVLDAETGSPIAGATLNGRNVTDRQGRGEIRGSFPATVRIMAAGYVPRTALLEEDESLERTVRLERAGIIGGIVRDEEGNPIRNAEVHLLENSMMRMVQSAGSIVPKLERTIVMTDADGHWLCAEGPRDIAGLNLKLSHPDYAATIYSTDPLNADSYGYSVGKPHAVALADLKAKQAELVMKRGFPVVGSVLDPQGRPVEGANVSLTLPNAPDEALGETKTGPDGQFVFRNSIAVMTMLKVQARGYVSHNARLDLQPGMRTIQIYLVRGVKLRVRVTNETGRPVAGAIITAGEFPLQERTDDDGRLQWDSAPAKPFMIHIRAEGYAEADEPVEAGPRENVIRLRNYREIHVTGRVLDAKTRQPIPEFQVLISTSRLGPERWQNYRRATAGKDGIFSLPLHDSFRPSGTVVQSDSSGDRVVRYVVGFKIQADGYFPDTSQTVAIENGDASFEVKLEPGEGMSGIVRLPGGEPVSGAQVFLSGRLGLGMISPNRINRVSDDSLERVTDAAG